MDVGGAASTNANVLCDDLMMQILSRLPSKPLAICKCVCKSWRHLVSTLTSHSPARPRELTGLFIVSDCLLTGHKAIHYCHRGDGEINMEETLSFLPSHPHTEIVASRDGFLLLGSSLYLGYEDEYCVCNPLTGQWVTLPLPPQRRCKSRNAALVFDDESSDFGCLHYKVVRFSTVRLEIENALPRLFIEHLYIDVYSSHTGKWVESKAFLEGDMSIVLHLHPVLLDGVLFLWADTVYLVMYDVKEDCCKLLDMDDCLGVPPFYCRCFGESEGCPSYAFHDCFRMEVWMFPDNGSGWVSKHYMELTDIGFPDNSAGSMWKLELLAFHPNLDAIFISKEGDFFCYNFDTKALETIMSWHPSASDAKTFSAFPFSECICPLPDAQYK